MTKKWIVDKDDGLRLFYGDENFNGSAYPCNDIVFMKMIVDKLNKLEKENEQLKSDLQKLQDSLWTTEKIRELEKENEQLKQQIKIFEKFLETNDLDIDWVEFCRVDECAFENPDFSCQECIHLKGDVE